MQVDYFIENSISFKITNDCDDAVNVFYGVMDKCRQEASKKGFRNMFTSDEKAFIKEFTDKFAINEVKH
jgi:hypothetical protein